MQQYWVMSTVLAGDYCGFCGRPLEGQLRTCGYCGNTMCEACITEHERACSNAKNSAQQSEQDGSDGQI